MDTGSVIRADRQQFIDCVNGDLLSRDASGSVTQLGDAATHAVEAAERGELVILTVHGKDFSRIKDGQEIAL